MNHVAQNVVLPSTAWRREKEYCFQFWLYFGDQYIKFYDAYVNRWNGLVPIEEIIKISTKLIVNESSYKTKFKDIKNLINELESSL